MDGWKQLMGDNLLILERHEDVSKVIPEIIARNTPKTEVKSATAATQPGTPVLL
jgi:hypothetical protein